MADREKVIKGIHQHCEGSMFDRCGECPYYEIDHESFVCRDMLLNDLNKLLKEQEAVKPRWIRDIIYPAGAFACGACGERIVEKGIDFYCSKCGQEVKWE